MPRTDATLVAGIVEVDGTINLDPFILAANEIVTEVCAVATKEDGSAWHTEARLTVIETWLAAHFYCILDPRADMEHAGSVSVRYQYKVDLGLNVTTYGQQAILLDTSGGLAKLNEDLKKGKAQISIQFGGVLPEDTKDFL